MDTTGFLYILSSISTIAAGIVGMNLYRKQELMDSKERDITVLRNELKEARSRIKKLETFCETVYTTEKIEHHIIFIGPRGSGKSSIATLWCEKEKLIDSVIPTEGFNVYNYTYPVGKDEEYFDCEIEVKRCKKIEKSITFLDYSGEDQEIPHAIDSIANSENCTIIMVFNSDTGHEADNKRYFSRWLIHRIDDTFRKTGFKVSRIKAVYVVFNKIDLFASSTGNYDDQLGNIREIFSDTIQSIQEIFGIHVNFIVTSVTTNHNILNLLRKIIRSYINE